MKEDAAVSGHERSASDDPAASLRRERPGWLTRLFGIEPARLVACDSMRREEGWQPAQTRLYAGRPGCFFVVTGVRDWRSVDADEARRTFRGLPVRLATEREVFEAGGGVAPGVG